MNYTCSYCSTSYKTRNGLTSHEKTQKHKTNKVIETLKAENKMLRSRIAKYEEGVIPISEYNELKDAYTEVRHLYDDLYEEHHDNKLEIKQEMQLLKQINTPFIKKVEFYNNIDKVEFYETVDADEMSEPPFEVIHVNSQLEEKNEEKITPILMKEDEEKQIIDIFNNYVCYDIAELITAYMPLKTNDERISIYNFDIFSPTINKPLEVGDIFTYGFRGDMKVCEITRMSKCNVWFKVIKGHETPIKTHTDHFGETYHDMKRFYIMDDYTYENENIDRMSIKRVLTKRRYTKRSNVFTYEYDTHINWG